MIRPSFLSGVLALALAASGCNAPPPAPKDAPESGSEKVEVEPVPESSPKAGGTETPKAVPVEPEPPVTYAASLEPLLDLVPGADEHFIALRDAGALLKLFDAFVGVATPTVLERFSDQPNVAEARVVLEELAKLRDAMIEAKVDLDKGMLFLEDPGVVVYGIASEDPTAIKIALKAAGVKESDLPPTCVAPPAMPGYAACGDDEASLKSLTPGKHGAAYQKAFSDRLVGFELERGNAVFRLEGPEGPVMGAIATPPGRVHVAVSLAEVAKEIGTYVGAGKADALGLLSAGAAFVWGRLDLGAFESQLADAPPPVKNVVGTLTGEVMVGGVEGTVAGLLVGVDDPFPASGLVSLAALQTDMIESQLPAGSSVRVEPVDLGDSKTQALHVSIGLDENSKKMLDALKVTPSAWGFSAGKYAGAVFGGSDAAVKTVGSYEPKPPTLTGVPSNLASALGSGDVGIAVYLPFDALQAATIRDTLQQAILAAPGEPLADPKTIEAAYDLVSPLSSLAVWLSHPDDARVLHVSIDAFADATTEEGKDALEALGKVIAGSDPAETYSALAAKYPSSPRALRYRIRAGTVDGGSGPAAMSSSFLLGMVAGISIPAFQKYIDRSRAAAAEVSEAERALMEAEQALQQQAP